MAQEDFDGLFLSIFYIALFKEPDFSRGAFTNWRVLLVIRDENKRATFTNIFRHAGATVTPRLV